MRIALLGTRGVPANYGGFETFAEEVAARLAARGHAVTVYGRAHHVPRGLRAHRGARIVVLPTLRSKHLDTVVHTFLAALHASSERFDAVVLVNAANSPFVPFLHATGARVALCVDGIERQRRKWGAAGRAWYRFGERLAVRWADALVTDAEVIARYYRERYAADPAVIAYGGDFPRPSTRRTLEALGLQPGGYLLYVSRLEPENNADFVIRAFRGVETDRRLVVVGSAPYAADFVARVRREAAEDPRVLLPGAIYGEGYRELQTNAFAYVHATEVGGTHPALLEGLWGSGVVATSDTPENLEVAGDAALPYRLADEDSLRAALDRILGNEGLRAGLRERARARILERYNWDGVVDRFEGLLSRLVDGAALATGGAG